MILQPQRGEVLPYFTRLTAEYRTYCETVSSRGMALSIESCSYLWWLCDTMQARQVADLGSGFSSYVLRLYAADAAHDVIVDSVDSDAGWLENTRRFCEANGQTAGGFLTGPEWERTDRRYDVIINDYANGATRERFAGIAASRLTPAGALMFDDIQNADHHNNAGVVCISEGLTLLDIHHQTVDEVGRFAGIGARL